MSGSVQHPVLSLELLSLQPQPSCAGQAAGAWVAAARPCPPPFMGTVRAAERNKAGPLPPGSPSSKGPHRDDSALPLTGASAALKLSGAQSSFIARVGARLVGIPQAVFKVLKALFLSSGSSWVKAVGTLGGGAVRLADSRCLLGNHSDRVVGLLRLSGVSRPAVAWGCRAE